MDAVVKPPSERSSSTRVAVDPITLEMIRHGVVGPDGELIVQCRGGMPVFTQPMD